MTWYTVGIILGLVVAASAVGAWLLRRYALKSNMIDVPGHRSSHTVPTPRGGGLAGGAAFVAAVGVFGWLGDAPLAQWLGLLGGGAVCLITGWLEDRHGVSIFIRLGLHILAALVLLIPNGGLPFLNLGGYHLPLGWLGWPLGVIWIVWFTNLFNFMDGIDGIAGLEALMGGAALGLFFLLLGHGWLAASAAALAAAGGSFLLLNWPPAKIFMGDVGSYGFGFGLAGLAYLGEQAGGPGLITCATVLLVFIADATYTLLRRLIKGEAVHQAHRSHIYQRATQGGLTHGQVDVIVAGLNALLIAFAALGLWIEPAQPLGLILGFFALVCVGRCVNRMYTGEGC